MTFKWGISLIYQKCESIVTIIIYHSISKQMLLKCRMQNSVEPGKIIIYTSILVNEDILSFNFKIPALELLSTSFVFQNNVAR